jgi:hypothetical protein
LNTLSSPFLDERYASAFGDSVLVAPSLPVPLIERPIDRSPLTDAQLPWPYVTLAPGTLLKLGVHHPQLVSIVGVLLPTDGSDLNTGGTELVPLKPHFIFDPKIGQKQLSSKSRGNLSEAMQVWHFRTGGTGVDWLAFQGLYGELVRRRQLTGTRFDFSPSHFTQLSTLADIRLFGVHNGAEWGAMICASQYRDELHMIHLVVSETGLTTNASYALMQALIDMCSQRETTLYLGGVPAGDQGGVLKFKSRWANRTLGSWLFRLVVRPDVYNSLAIPGNSFFPSYRTGW